MSLRCEPHKFDETHKRQNVSLLFGINPTITSPSKATKANKMEDKATMSCIKDKPVLDKALPPWHSVAFSAFVTTTCIYQCRSTIHSLDEVAVLDTFTHRVFPTYLSIAVLGWIRLAIAMSIWYVLVSTITSEGWIQTTTYKPGSTLQSGVKLIMKGSRTLLPFTSWCWILLGLSFTFNAGLSLAVAYQGEEWTLHYLQSTPWIIRSILLTWETAAPCAFLVSTVIRYVIWDMVLKAGGPERTVQLKHFRQIMSHNLNSVFVLTEMALLGGLPVRLSEMYLGALLGSFYIWGAWALQRSWVPKEFGPQFLYFFLDTTMGYTTTLSLAALTMTLCLFHMLLSTTMTGLAQLTSAIENPALALLCHLLFVMGIASLVCRFND